jgi:nucleoside-diphosphate-sugar epimerase
MKVFVAGASGAIGRPLIAELLSHGHTVTGMTQSEAGAKRLIEQGATAEVANALDVSSVESALRRSQAEVVIDELTALPKNPADLPAALPGDRRLRLEGGGNLHRAALKIGIRRYIQQSSGFFLKAGSGLADESVGLAVDASPGVASSAQTYTELEGRVLNSSPMEGVSLRYGFFMGRIRGTTQTAARQIRFGSSRSLLLVKDRGSGPGFTLKTRPSPRLLLLQLSRVSTSLWMMIRLP